MSQEMPPKMPVSDVDLERYIDRPFDLVARVRVAKEAAQREMESFGNVSEYEIRKIYGQKSELSYDAQKDDHKPQPSASTEVQPESPLLETREKPRPKESQSAFDFDTQDPAPQNHSPEEA